MKPITHPFRQFAVEDLTSGEKEKAKKTLADLVSVKVAGETKSDKKYVGMGVPTDLYGQICELVGVDPLTNGGGALVFKKLLTVALNANNQGSLQELLNAGE